jgi:hypothetical protein
VRRALFFIVVVGLLVPACGGTDRPEGVVERWLISLNQGRAGEPEKYAPEALSQMILPNWQRRDPGDLDVIEVGKGRPAPTTRPYLTPRSPSYLVPYRVERLDGRASSGVAGLLLLARGGWTVSDLLPPSPSLKVPSEGGERLGGASALVWLFGLAAAALFVLVSVALMSAVGSQARVSA